MLATLMTALFFMVRAFGRVSLGWARLGFGLRGCANECFVAKEPVGLIKSVRAAGWRGETAVWKEGGGASSSFLPPRTGCKTCWVGCPATGHPDPLPPGLVLLPANTAHCAVGRVPGRAIYSLAFPRAR